MSEDKALDCGRVELNGHIATSKCPGSGQLPIVDMQHGPDGICLRSIICGGQCVMMTGTLLMPQ